MDRAFNHGEGAVALSVINAGPRVSVHTDDDIGT
jgi:hypothetical protein